jgi:hypothetical protein
MRTLPPRRTLRRVGAQPEARQEELDLLATMQTWASQHTANPDAKAAALITYLRAVCRPDGTLWTNERVVVFTEYRDTQLWLPQLLRQEGFAAERVALLHGGLDPDDREELRQAFQAGPSAHPVRILLATDAASEGMDLHWHCHRLVNYDIPFNPNKLEQRIGRIDRCGQKSQPEIRHRPASAGSPPRYWTTARARDRRRPHGESPRPWTQRPSHPARAVRRAAGGSPNWGSLWPDGAPGRGWTAACAAGRDAWAVIQLRGGG